MLVLAFKQFAHHFRHQENYSYQEFSVMPQVTKEPVTAAMRFLNNRQRQFFTALSLHEISPFPQDGLGRFQVAA
jgi:hypothetical protein